MSKVKICSHAEHFCVSMALSTHTHTWYKYCIGITPEKLLYSLSYEWKSTKTQVTIMNVMSPIAPLVPVLHPNFVTVFQTYDMSTDSGHGSTRKQTMSKSTTKQSCWMPRFVYKTKNGKRFHFPTLKTSVLHLWHLWFMNLRGHRYKRTMSKRMFGLNGKPCFVFRNQNTSLIL